MEQLWITLPAFAPDYSGVCSAMFDLKGLTVVHDASGCTGNIQATMSQDGMAANQKFSAQD